MVPGFLRRRDSWDRVLAESMDALDLELLGYWDSAALRELGLQVSNVFGSSHVFMYLGRLGS